MDAAEENEKKALVAAGVAIGVVGAFAAILKAALEQAAANAKKGDGE